MTKTIPTTEQTALADRLGIDVNKLISAQETQASENAERKEASRATLAMTDDAYVITIPKTAVITTEPGKVNGKGKAVKYTASAVANFGHVGYAPCEGVSGQVMATGSIYFKA